MIRLGLALPKSTYCYGRLCAPPTRNLNSKAHADKISFVLGTFRRTNVRKLLPEGDKSRLSIRAVSQSAKMSNRLANEESPYLLQHAHNPVRAHALHISRPSQTYRTHGHCSQSDNLQAIFIHSFSLLFLRFFHRAILTCLMTPWEFLTGGLVSLGSGGI